MIILTFYYLYLKFTCCYIKSQSIDLLLLAGFKIYKLDNMAVKKFKLNNNNGSLGLKVISVMKYYGKAIFFSNLKNSNVIRGTLM
jgi:hypothetical protein